MALPDNDPVWLPQHDFSVSLWAYFERNAHRNVSQSEVILDLNHGSSADFLNELGCNIQRRGDTGKIAFQMTTAVCGDEDLYSHAVPARFRWHHIVAVREGASQRLYINGELDSARPCAPAPVDYCGGYDDDKVSIGRFTTTVGLPRYHLQGMVDEVMVFEGALSAREIRELYHYGDIGGTHAELVRLDHPNEVSAFVTIQEAIDAANDGDIIRLGPGVYRQSIDLAGKRVTVESGADVAILEAPRDAAVVIGPGTGPETVLRNVIIRNSLVAVQIPGGSPTITNVTVVGNEYGIVAFGNAEPRISDCILWDNGARDLFGCHTTYSCIERWAEGEGNFGEDPLFVDPVNGDYHLLSSWGRYWPEHDVWVLDETTSLCIDAGDPAADFSAEPASNGGRINVGAHGGTAFASRSEPPFSLDVTGDDVIDVNDLEAYMNLWEAQVPTP